MKKTEKLEVTWLCQGGFLLQSGSVRLVIDPYMSNSLAERGLQRMVPIPIGMADLRPTLVCCTHDHGDHFDEQTMVPLRQMYPDCKIVGPTSVREHCSRLGFDMTHFVTLNCGEMYVNYGVSIYGVKAFHTDPYSIGLLIQMGGRTIYLSGDTTLEPDLLTNIMKATASSIDLMLICMNGKLGNMNANEAAELVCTLQPKVAVPMHYGLFAENTADPEPFVKAVGAGGVESIVMQPGVTIEF